MTRKPGSHDPEGNPSGNDVDDGNLPPLDAELRALFAAERRHPGPSAGSSERVRLAVLATAAAAAAGSGAATAAGAAAGAAGSGGIAAGGASTGIASVGASVGATSGVGTTVGTAATGTVAGGALAATAGTSAAATSGAIGSSIGIGLGGGVLKGGLAIAAAIAATAGGGVLIANYEVAEPSPFEDVAVEVVEDTLGRPKPPAGLVVDAPPSDDSNNNNNAIGIGNGKAVKPRLAVKQAPPVNTLARPEADTAVDTAVDEGPTPPMSEEDLATERGLIANARHALRDDDGGGALLAVTAHADRFPRGLLREERDAIQIMALLRMGRRDQADALATRFAARYPRSLFAEAIRQARERADR